MNTIHGLWINDKLGRLEQLSIASFLRHGYPYNLWTYNGLDGMPKGAVQRDANEILPADKIFHCQQFGPGKTIQGFSDLFRYQLLYKEGGWWADLDVTLLRPLPVTEHSLAVHKDLGCVGNLMHMPKGSPIMKEAFEACERVTDISDWMWAVHKMLDSVKRHKVRPVTTYLGGDDPAAIRPLVFDPGSSMPQWVGIHWMHAIWLGPHGYWHKEVRQGTSVYKERCHIFDCPVPNTVYDRLLQEHGV